MAQALEKKLKRLKRQRAIILAEDEAVLFLQATLAAIWQPKGKTIRIKAFAGQAKQSFYGALNLRTGKEHVMRCDTQKKISTIRFLGNLRRAYPRRRIAIFWDNAPWHKGLGEYLRKARRIELIPFPPYSPELNPQEGVWKKARKAVSHNHTFRIFPSLISAFETYLKKNVFRSNFLKNHS